MPTVLTIAGSDSIAGAGIQADLKTFAALGVYGTCAITAVTAQSTTGVTRIVPLPADVVRAQIDAVTNDARIAAVKTGMLATDEIVRAVAQFIGRSRQSTLVVDPVMSATHSQAGTLLSEAAVSILKTELLPLTVVVTPNAAEATVLSGVTVDSLSTAREAARRISELGPAAVVVKGGHLPGPDSIDVLFHAGVCTTLAAPRANVGDVHGTGCTFASAIAAGLALGDDIPAAVQRAKEYVSGAIAHSLEIGRGARILNHFWQLSL